MAEDHIPSTTSDLDVKKETALLTSGSTEKIEGEEIVENQQTLLEQTATIKNVIKDALNELEQSQKEFGRISGLLESKLDKMNK